MLSTLVNELRADKAPDIWAKWVTGSGSRLFLGGFLIVAVVAADVIADAVVKLEALPAMLDSSRLFEGLADVDVLILSSMFLTWAPESSEPDEMESVSLAMPSRDDDLVEKQIKMVSTFV